MTKYLAGVLTVIAVGVLLVAYGLLTPRAPMEAVTLAPATGPMVTGAPVPLREPYASQFAYAPASSGAGYAAQPVQTVVYVPAASPQPGYRPTAAVTAVPPRPVRTASYETESPRRSAPRHVERKPERNWKRSALIIGGASATGAGVGAMVGGRKGALIGAAIGGGASTIYQVVK